MTREQAFVHWLESARFHLDRLASCHPAERLRNARSLHNAASRLAEIGMSHYAVSHPAPPESCAVGEPASTNPAQTD